MKMHGERGVTMVEFAIVIVPFFLLLFGTLELGFILWGTYDLENATQMPRVRSEQERFNRVQRHQTSSATASAIM